jgi:hypothetical protein
MTLTYVGGTSGSGTGATYTVSLNGTLTGGTNSSPQQGDIVVVMSGHGGTTNSAPTVTGNNNGSYTGAGVASYGNDTWDTNFRTFYKIQGVTVDTQITVARTSSTAYGGATVVQVWRNVDKTNPIDATGTPATGTNSSRANPPAVTPVTTGAVVVYGGAGVQPAASGVAPTDANGGDHVVSVKSDGSTADLGIYIASKTWTSGQYNPAANTNMATSTSCSWAAQTIALRPDTTDQVQLTAILGNKYFSFNGITLTEITAQEYGVGVSAGETHSTRIYFDTPSGELTNGLYATQANGYHWVKIAGYAITKLAPEFIVNNTISQAGIDEIKARSVVE